MRARHQLVTHWVGRGGSVGSYDYVYARHVEHQRMTHLGGSIRSNICRRMIGAYESDMGAYDSLRWFLAVQNSSIGDLVTQSLTN